VTSSPPELSSLEEACLTLLCVDKDITHGWAVASQFLADGSLGRVWTVTRPNTYRALELLAEKGLVERKGQAGRSGARERTLVTPTLSGRATAEAWLDAPVQHLRDVHRELLLKLLLRRRAGLPDGPFVRSQQAALAPTIERLLAGDPLSPVDDPVAEFRREQARTVLRFLDRLLVGELPSMRLSARNQLRATVTSVRPGDVMASVKVTLPDGQQLSAAITREAVEDLGLAVGDPVIAIVKSTEVMLAVPNGPRVA
jgi:molybdopterin-binding protein